MSSQRDRDIIPVQVKKRFVPNKFFISNFVQHSMHEKLYYLKPRNNSMKGLPTF